MEIISLRQAREQGLKFYFSGRPCKNGNLAPRSVNDPHCSCSVCKEDRRSNKDPDKKRAYNRKYYQENKSTLIASAVAFKRNRLATDPAYRAEHNLRRRLHIVVKAQGTAKAYRFNSVTGCTAPELKTHLEAQFRDGMSWENYGEWEVDHVRPCASYDLTDPEQQKECFHYTNLQPLWRKENAEKKAKWAA